MCAANLCVSQSACHTCSSQFHARSIPYLTSKRDCSLHSPFNTLMSFYLPTQAKQRLYLDRLLLITQRLRRSPKFQPQILSGGPSIGGPQVGWCEGGRQRERQGERWKSKGGKEGKKGARMGKGTSLLPMATTGALVAAPVAAYIQHACLPACSSACACHGTRARVSGHEDGRREGCGGVGKATTLGRHDVCAEGAWGCMHGLAEWFRNVPLQVYDV